MTPNCRRYETKALTAKKSKMTEKDRQEVSRLEWYLGLYLEDGALAVPTRNIKKCLVDSGKIDRHGTDVVKGLSFEGLHVPLIHNGNGSLEKMRTSGNFTSLLAVGIGQKKTMRVRPEFRSWKLDFRAVLFEDVMDLDTFERITERAGRAVGLGDNRVNGYGRFKATVERI